jgi:hypothetical protein
MTSASWGVFVSAILVGMSATCRRLQKGKYTKVTCKTLPPVNKAEIEKLKPLGGPRIGAVKDCWTFVLVNSEDEQDLSMEEEADERHGGYKAQRIGEASNPGPEGAAKRQRMTPDEEEVQQIIQGEAWRRSAIRWRVNAADMQKAANSAYRELRLRRCIYRKMLQDIKGETAVVSGVLAKTKSAVWDFVAAWLGGPEALVRPRALLVDQYLRMHQNRAQVKYHLACKRDAEENAQTAQRLSDEAKEVRRRRLHRRASRSSHES